MIDKSKMTHDEVENAITAVNASTYLMYYCGHCKFIDPRGCESCVFYVSDECAIKGSPFEYKSLTDKPNDPGKEGKT